MGSYDENLKVDKLWMVGYELEKECHIEIEDGSLPQSLKIWTK
jgi:hypothetical protein